MKDEWNFENVYKEEKSEIQSCGRETVREGKKSCDSWQNRETWQVCKYPKHLCNSSWQALLLSEKVKVVT